MEIEFGKDWARVVLSGEIDMAWVVENQPAFDAMCQGEFRAALVDVEAVTFMDSTGLGLIARLCRICSENHGRVFVTKPNSQVLNSMEIVGLANLPVITVLQADGDIHDLKAQLEFPDADQVPI